MQKIITIIICLTITITAKTQDSLTYALGNIAVIPNGKEVRLNETVPDIQLAKIINYTKPTATLNDFLNKPCILIFWHQFCPTCRKELQTIESMKKELANKVNILLVTFQSRASVIDFISGQKKAGRHFSYPTVTEDTLLRKTFPHDGDPHLVWINNKKVQAITDHLAFNIENVQQWLTTGKANLPYKHLQKDFDNAKPLLVNNNGGTDDAFQYRSLITRFIDSIKGTPLIVEQNEKYTRIFMANATIDQLFKQLFIKMDTSAKFLDLDWMDKRVVIAYTNPSVTKNLYNAYDKGFDAFYPFQQQHLYTYELILPVSYSEQEAMQYMQEDLQRYFHIKAAIAKKEVRGLALKYNGKCKLNTMTIAEKENYKINGDSLLVLKNNELWSLVNTLNLNYDLPFVVDETNCNGTINVQMNFIKRDRETVANDLARFDFMFEEKKYTMDMLVLSDLQ